MTDRTLYKPGPNVKSSVWLRVAATGDPSPLGCVLQRSLTAYCGTPLYLELCVTAESDCVLRYSTLQELCVTAISPLYLIIESRSDQCSNLQLLCSMSRVCA